jgi:PAS domain-containing protein
VLESASEGIILIDGTGRIALVNTAAERMFAYPRAELRPMGIRLDLAGRRKDGTEFPLEISLSHVDAPDGTVAMAFITDISERKRIEGQLQRQREVLYQNEKLAALGTMAAGIAHE